MCPPGLRLSRGQQSFLLKFLYASLFEHAAKSNEGIIVAFIAKIIVALNECYNIGGLANEMDLLKDLDTLAFHNCKANLADCYQGKQKSARVYCRSSTFAKQRTWLLNGVRESARHKLLQHIVQDSELFSAGLEYFA